MKKMSIYIYTFFCKNGTINQDAIVGVLLFCMIFCCFCAVFTKCLPDTGDLKTKSGKKLCDINKRRAVAMVIEYLKEATA